MSEQPKDQEPPTEGYCYLCARASSKPVCLRCEAAIQPERSAAEEAMYVTGRSCGFYKRGWGRRSQQAYEDDDSR